MLALCQSLVCFRCGDVHGRRGCDFALLPGSWYKPVPLHHQIILLQHMDKHLD
jgi:hypothetical protein